MSLIDIVIEDLKCLQSKLQLDDLIKDEDWFLNDENGRISLEIGAAENPLAYALQLIHNYAIRCQHLDQLPIIGTR